MLARRHAEEGLRSYKEDQRRRICHMSVERNHTLLSSCGNEYTTGRIDNETPLRKNCNAEICLRLGSAVVVWVELALVVSAIAIARIQRYCRVQSWTCCKVGLQNVTAKADRSLSLQKYRFQS